MDLATILGIAIALLGIFGWLVSPTEVPLDVPPITAAAMASSS